MSYITITANNSLATHAQRLKAIIEGTKRLLVDGDQLLAELREMFGPEGAGKFTLIAQKLGITGDTANVDAQTVFEMLDGEQTAMRGEGQIPNAQAVALANRVG